jgi:hypothetical protein
LTPRELEVAELLTQGLTNRELDLSNRSQIGSGSPAAVEYAAE